MVNYFSIQLTLALALSVLDQASGFVRGEHSHIRGFLRKHLIPMSSFGQQNSHMRFKVGSLREKLNEEAKYINYFRFHKVGEDTDEDNRIALVHDLFRLRPRIEDLVTLQEDERKPEFARDDGSDQRSSWRIIGNSMNKPPLMEDGQSRFALRWVNYAKKKPRHFWVW